MPFENRKLYPVESKEWKFMNFMSKPLIKFAMRKMAGKYRKMIEHKMQHGFINPEIALLYDNMSEIIEKDQPCFTGEGDPIEQFYKDMRDMMCVILDEDSHYLLRFFYFIEILHRDYEKYNISMHKEKVYWDWAKIKKGLTEMDERWAEHNSRQIIEAMNERNNARLHSEHKEDAAHTGTAEEENNKLHDP